MSIRLGIHNYQTQNARAYLSPGAPLLMRHNCQPLMLGGIAAWASVFPGLEGKPLVYSPGGTASAQRKYTTGPYSAAADNAGDDIFGTGTASCPSVAAYQNWCQEVYNGYNADISHWEVWNEADAPEFFRGTPADLVDLTFAAYAVWGAKTIAPSFTILTWGDSPVAGMTRSEFIDAYYTTLIARAVGLGVSSPIAATTVHGYGGGATVQAAADTRLTFLTSFKNRMVSLGLSHIPMWDTEFNLRNNVSGGFADTPANAAIWAQSVRDAADLGYARQYAYLWEDDEAVSGFQSTQLQFHPGTTHVNAAFQELTLWDPDEEFTSEFSTQFAVYQPTTPPPPDPGDPVVEFSDQFSPEFNAEFAPPYIPDDPQRALRWRLISRVGGILFNWQSVTSMAFTAEMGRDDPDEQPGPGRATFTMLFSGEARASEVYPGATCWLEVNTGAGDTQTWYRVWTGTVTDVTRAFRLVDGKPYNEIRLDATGPSTQLERVKIPVNTGGAYPEQRDGLRVWTVLYQLGVRMSAVRPETGHLVNDTFPDHAAWWNHTTQTVTGGTQMTFTRSVAMPAVTVAPRNLEVVVSLQLSAPALVWVNVAGRLAEFIYLRAGEFVLTGEVDLPADVAAPTVAVVAVPQDDVWLHATWNTVVDSDTTWDDMPVTQTWDATPGAGVSTTMTLLGVDVWRSGWDWGSVMLIARDPTNEQTARDHIEEVARAARGTLWEQRDGGLSYASQLSRLPNRLPTLNLPASVVVAETESTQTLSALVNDITVSYWWSGLDDDGNQTPRPSVHLVDQGSIDSYGGDPEGRYEATIDGPLRDRASAVATAQQVLRASARPRERISALRLIPLNKMRDVDAINLLTVPPGAQLQVDGTPPAGWVPSGAGGEWRGFIEGWTLTGETDGDVAVTLAVSEFFEAATAAYISTGTALGST